MVERTDHLGKASGGFALWAAIGVVAAMTWHFVLEGHVGASLADEGYLWYGAQRVLHGEVPIRDFMSYDPGRYYWSAAVMDLLGDDGIIALRIAASAFQALGLFVAILLLRHARPRASAAFLLLAGATLLIWMVPRHKVFDVSISVFLVGALAQLIERPTIVRHFLMGLVVGAAAILGRNHGVYGLVASFAAIGVLAWQGSGASLWRGLAAFSGGVFIGYLPMVIAVLAVPGLFDAFLKDVLNIFEYGTNLTLPVPWPWSAAVRGQPRPDIVHWELVGIFFVGLLLFAVLGLAYVLTNKLTRANATFAAAVFLAVPYAHFAFSRADVAHLAQGIFPLLIGVMVAPIIASERARLLLVLGLLVVSLPVVARLHPAWQAWRDGNWQPVMVGHDRLASPPGVAADFKLLQQLVEKYAPEGRPFVAEPFWPGAYAAFKRKAPVFDTYALFPQSAANQEAEITRIRAADPGFVLVLDTMIDGMDERRFRKTHPSVYRYIEETFAPAPETNGPLKVFVPRFGAR